MNIDKMSNRLGVPFSTNKETTEAPIGTSVVLVENKALKVYTESTELMAEITNYRDNRNKSIECLESAREIIKNLFDDKNYVNSIIVGFEPKALDSFAKVASTLSVITEKIDSLSHPSRVEVYIDPPEKKNDQAQIVHNEQNNYLFSSLPVNPAELVDIIRTKIKEETQLSSENIV